MHRVFEHLVYFMVTNSLGLGDVEDQQYQDQVTTLGLELFYYWNNFAPLSRGASAVGYTILYACILASGAEVSERVPPMTQLDFEAFLSRSFREFLEKVGHIVMKRKKSSLPRALTNPLFSMELSTSGDSGSGTDSGASGSFSDSSAGEIDLTGEAISISDVNDEEVLISLPIVRAKPQPPVPKSEPLPLLLSGRSSVLVSAVFNTSAAITYTLANLDSFRPVPEMFKL